MKHYITKHAAEFINLKVTESFTYWTNFLINNRNKSRNPPYRIPYDKVGGDVIYSEMDLLHFIEWENYRRKGTLKINRYTQFEKLNFDFHESSQRFSKDFSCFFQIEKDIKTKKQFIILNIHRPIPAYRLSLEEAEHLKALISDVIQKLNSK